MAVPSPLSVPLDKSLMRDEYRQHRRVYAASLAHETRAALEQQLVTVLDPILAGSRIVAGYQPMKHEISPLAVLRRAFALGKTTALPAFVDRDSRMTFRTGEPSEPGPWGLLQPPLEQPPVQPDLILVPLLGCDPGGNRIGMGKGHYDRALEGLRNGARLVGVGWEFQLSDIPFAADPWDQPLDAFASPAGLTEFER